MRAAAVIATVGLLLISNSHGISHAASLSDPPYTVVKLESPNHAQLSPVGQSEAKQFQSQLLAQQGPQATSPPRQQGQKPSGVSCSSPTTGVTAEAATSETIAARESAFKRMQAAESRGGVCALRVRSYSEVFERADAGLNNLINTYKKYKGQGHGGLTAGMWHGYCVQYAVVANGIPPECR